MSHLARSIFRFAASTVATATTALALHAEYASLDDCWKLPPGWDKYEETLPWTTRKLAKMFRSSIYRHDIPLFHALTSLGLVDIHANADDALCIATHVQNEHVVKYLLDEGSSMNLQHGYARKRAFQHANASIVKLFIDHGAPVDGQDLVNAMTHARFDVANVVLQSIVAVPSTSAYIFNGLISQSLEACHRHCHSFDETALIEFLKTLLHRKYWFTEQEFKDSLWLSISLQRPKLVSFVLTQKPSDYIPPTEMLIAAASNLDAKTVQVLLDAGSVVSKDDYKALRVVIAHAMEQSPLDSEEYNQCRETLMVLINQCSEAKHLVSELLELAYYYKDFELAHIVFERMQGGFEAIDSCFTTDLDMFRFLIKAGAISKIKTNHYLIEAARVGNDSLIELLLEHGSDVHVLDEAPLLIAAVYGHYSTVKRLLKAGANPKALGLNILKQVRQAKSNATFPHTYEKIERLLRESLEKS